MQEHVQVESSKCKACRRCEVACIASHHGLDFKTAMKQKALYSPRCWAVKGDDFKTSVRCHCCDPAPCCNICPMGALVQHADGSFEFHLELCAGCMMCMSVCPYGVISPEQVGRQENPDNLPATGPEPRTIAARCDLCHDWRLEKGVEYTACMEACMTQALMLVRSDGTILEMPKPEKKPAPAKPQVEAAATAPKAEDEKKNKVESAAEAKEAPQGEAKDTAPIQAQTAQAEVNEAELAQAETTEVDETAAQDGRQAKNDKKNNNKKNKKKK